VTDVDGEVTAATGSDSSQASQEVVERFNVSDATTRRRQSHLDLLQKRQALVKAKARPHTGRVTRDKHKSRRSEILSHAPCSLDIPPPDHRLSLTPDSDVQPKISKPEGTIN
jgi:hypothetical protein